MIVIAIVLAVELLEGWKTSFKKHAKKKHQLENSVGPARSNIQQGWREAASFY